MSAVPERSIVPFARFEQLREAQDVIRHEAEALEEVARRLDERFCDAIDCLLACTGRVIVTGIGKAGLIGQKITATLCSTGTRAQFLHPAEAVHGDLGCLSQDDVVIALSNSGETEEVCRLLPILRQAGVELIAVTSTATNSLSTAASVTIPLGRLREADAHGLAPSTTTTAMLAIGDALAFVLSRLRAFSPAEFARNHPGGSLGRRLTTVQEIMRPAGEARIAPDSVSVREVFTKLAQPGRRTGAVMLVDESGRLSGLFTDSDLARLLESRCDDQLDDAIRHVMTERPHTVPPHARLEDVVDLLADRKISEIPVVDDEHRPVGLIDITDVIGVLPAQEEAA